MYQQLWGYKVEEKLYLGVREQKRLNTTAIEDLKTNISEAIASINQRTLRRVAENMVKRVNACIQENVGHFKHLL
jgi:hypothetical protein